MVKPTPEAKCVLENEAKKKIINVPNNVNRVRVRLGLVTQSSQPQGL